MPKLSDLYRSPADLPDRLSIFPLRGTLLLPRTELPLVIFEPRYLEMISDALAGNRLIGMIQPVSGALPGRSEPALMEVGCAGRITSYLEIQDGRVQIALTGISRFVVKKEISLLKPYRLVHADFYSFQDDLMIGLGAVDIDRSSILRVLRAYLEANHMEADWCEIGATPTENLINNLSLIAPYRAEEKQALLEAPNLKARSEVLLALTEMALAKARCHGSRLQ